MRTPWVEQENCISCGLCISSCPEVFRFNDKGKAECHDAAGATETKIEAAMDACPVQCIEWKEK